MRFMVSSGKDATKVVTYKHYAYNRTGARGNSVQLQTKTHHRRLLQFPGALRYSRKYDKRLNRATMPSN
jgi:hypothetical protein